ncbi:hypothetical protein MPDQ_001121 [Monascus purpureus]|uniref:Mei2-like C-terminal RNA recognition motif domain-containing protein n=1 Tax=Monascus purpureus TaxID=5098 RepID=A0A507QQJ9_MONPU|nr:hypothetical protein MPDQ_001121 [Monascus purpureus]
MSSPCSSIGAVSPHGSPDTKLTAFSPEDVRSRGRDSSLCVRLSDDKFCGVYSLRMQLSPTAESFTPVGTAGGAPSGSPTLSMTHGRSGIGYLTAGSFSDTNGLVNVSKKFSEQNPVDTGCIGKSQPLRDPVPSTATAEHLDSERRSRAFVIEKVPATLSYMALAGFFNRREFGTLKGPVLTELSSLGKVYVAFTDSREAKGAMEKVCFLHPEWRVVPITAREYVQHSEPSLLSQTSDFEGQLLVSVYYDGRNPRLNQHTVAHSLETLVTTFGDVKSLNHLPSGQGNVSEFHIEFFDTRDAENAMTTLNGTSVDNCLLEVTLFRPDIDDKPQAKFTGCSPGKEIYSRNETPYRKHYSWTSSRPIRSPYMELSPTGRSTIPSGERATLMDWMSTADNRLLSSPHHYADLRSNNQNSVDIERIRLGLDVRTTIMLRNIPNKIDQAIVDETSHGKYDFMYLRIDFANNCNVGYAFINFEDPIDIIDFVNARAGRSWNCFNSDKVAEVSYATIQGKDCLVQKFRNSSVMLEHPSFRPKIFHTGTGPLAGTEDRFPGPDNPSKMRRSIENAEHVGLFAPRVGQQYRDEQRRRRSQFDRGTSAAEREIVHGNVVRPLSHFRERAENFLVRILNEL